MSRSDGTMGLGTQEQEQERAEANATTSKTENSKTVKHTFYVMWKSRKSGIEKPKSMLFISFQNFSTILDFIDSFRSSRL